jgi:carboxyl-terminal processing protease
VLQARPGSPAEKAGIKAGDAILAVDGKDVRGQSFGVVEFALHGRPDTPITLKVQSPGGEPRTVTFNRYSSEVPLPASAAIARPTAPAPGALQPASRQSTQK